MFQLRGLGAEMTPGEDRGAAAAYCLKKFSGQSPHFQPCVEHYANPHIGEYTTGTGTFIKPALMTTNLVKDQIVNATMNPGASAMTQLMPAGVPWYKTPLGIGAILLGAFVGYRYLKR